MLNAIFRYGIYAIYSMDDIFLLTAALHAASTGSIYTTRHDFIQIFKSYRSRSWIRVNIQSISKNDQEQLTIERFGFLFYEQLSKRTAMDELFASLQNTLLG